MSRTPEKGFPLLQGVDSIGESLTGGSDTRSKSWVLTNFVLMCLCFSLNHGCVTACVALASSDLGPDLGAYSSGTLYLVYTLTALFGSSAIVQLTGIKHGLSSSLFVYCAYIASFIAAKQTTGEIKWILTVTGSVLGGFAAGFLWTAQGPFVTAATKLYALHTPLTSEEQGETSDERMKKATSFLSSIFAVFYLVCEAAMKVLSTVIPDQFSGGETTLYVVFTIVSVGCAIGMEVLVADLSTEYNSIKISESSHATAAAEESLLQQVTGKVVVAIKLLVSDPKMILMYPVQMGFGFASTFVGYYANGILIVSCVNSGGTNYVGYFAALIAVTAGLLSPVLSFVTRKLGGNKVPVMTLGLLAFLLEMVVYASYNLHADDLVRGEKICAVAPLVGLYMLHGLGRGVWESTNKAVIIDFFPNDPKAAFANVIVSSGSASTIGFFLYQFHKDLKNDPLPITILTTVLCAIGLVTFPIAASLNRSQKLEAQSKSASLNRSQKLKAQSEPSAV